MEMNIQDYFEASQVPFSFKENDSDVDGVHVIAKVVGPACFDGAASRNKRWYPEGHWPKQFEKSDVKRKLADRTMFGAWGHELELTDEELAKGLHSHITTKLWMEGKVGKAEYLILNTPAGRVLNTTLRAKSKLAVSTRGSGDYSGEYEGMPQVDPETFNLERIDFVVNPGFLQARPDLVECIREDLRTLGFEVNESLKKNPMEESNMSDVNESLIKEQARTAAELRTMTTKLEEVQVAYKVAAEQNDKFRENQLNLENENKKLSDKVAYYEKCGANGELKTRMEQLAALQKFVTELEEAELIDKGQLLEGHGVKMGAVFDTLISEHNELKKIHKDFGNYAKLDQFVNVVENTLSEIKAIGTVSEIKQVMHRFEKLMSSVDVNRVRNSAHRISTKFGFPESAIMPLVKKGLTEKEIAGVLNTASNVASNKKFKKESVVEKKTTEAKRPFDRNASIGKSLMEKFSAKVTN